MHLPARLEIDAVDDAVGVDMFTIYMGTDQHLAALKISRQPPCRFVCCARVDVCTFWKTLYHVVKHHAAILAVQQLRTQEFVERGFGLAADTADEMLTIPKRFIHLRNILHHAFHAPACLRPLFIVHEMDDCDFTAPPS